MDRGAWRTIVYGVSKSQTRLSTPEHKVPNRLLSSCLRPAWPLGAASVRFLVSLCACHCPWTPKAPRCSQGKPEGDEVTSSPSSGAAGAWVILEAVGSRVGSRILEGPTLGSPLPSTAPGQPTPVFLPGESPHTEEPGGLQSMGLQKSQTRLTDLTLGALFA